MSNYPDGWSHADEVAAGIAERVPGFESWFDTFVAEMEGWDDLTLDEQDRIREEEEERYAQDLADARAEDAAEDRAEWDGYEPW